MEIRESGLTTDTDSVVIRSLVAQWVEDVFVGMRVVTTVAVSLARDMMCFVSELGGFVLFWDTIDSMAAVKCF